MPIETYFIEGWRPDRARHTQNKSGCRRLEGVVPTGAATFRTTGRPFGGVIAGPKKILSALFVNTGEFALPKSFDGLYLAGNDGATTNAVGEVRRGSVDVTPASITAHPDTGGEMDWADMVQYGNMVILTDGLSPVWKSTGSTFTTLITSANKPQFFLVDSVGDHLLGAHCHYPGSGTPADDPLNPFKFWWSGRANEANWEPDSERAGFAYTRHSIGYITGLIGFADYALIFGSQGVMRLSLVSSATVFSQQYVAGSEFGTFHPRSIVACGPDVFYLSNSGFAAIRGGGQPQKLAIGKADRQLFNAATFGLGFTPSSRVPWQFGQESADPPSTAQPVRVIWGALDRQSGAVVWVAQGPGYYTSFSGIAYDPFSEEWVALWDGADKDDGAVFYGDPDDMAPALVTESDQLDQGPLGALSFFTYDDGATTRPEQQRAFDMKRTCRVKADSLVWSVEGQTTVTVQGVRPVFRNSDVDPIEATPVPPPDFVVYVKAFERMPPRDEEVYDWSAAVANDQEDDDGFLQGGDLPLTGRFFVFRLFREGSAADTEQFTEELSDLVGFDIEYVE